MLNQLFGHFWYIRWFPCEYVMMGPKEADERAYLFVA
jgi:hypothetical protein